jgi:hypothetical protein
VRIRLGLHTGEPVVGDDGYTGLDVVRASRIAATATGGQVLLSEATSAIVAKHLPEGVTLKSAGQRQLKDIDEPEDVFELVIPGVSVSAPSAALVKLAGPTPASPIPPDVLEDMPPWLQGLTQRFLSPTNRLIEDRVLAKIDEARAEAESKRSQRKGKGKSKGPPLDDYDPFAEPPPDSGPPSDSGPPPDSRPPRSLSDEIKRLQKLRDSGALSEEQYQRAVERAIGDTGSWRPRYPRAEMTDQAPPDRPADGDELHAPDHVDPTWRPETLAVHAGMAPDELTGAVAPPIYQTATYAQEAVGRPRGGWEYARTGNPTRSRFEAAVAALEGASYGLAFASGSATAQAIATLALPGERILCADDVYGGTFRLFERVLRDTGVDASYHGLLSGPGGDARRRARRAHTPRLARDAFQSAPEGHRHRGPRASAGGPQGCPR